MVHLVLTAVIQAAWDGHGLDIDPEKAAVLVGRVREGDMMGWDRLHLDAAGSVVTGPETDSDYCAEQ